MTKTERFEKRYANRILERTYGENIRVSTEKEGIAKTYTFKKEEEKKAKYFYDKAFELGYEVRIFYPVRYNPNNDTMTYKMLRTF